jgi:hypothetical protein
LKYGVLEVAAVLVHQQIAAELPQVAALEHMYLVYCLLCQEMFLQYVPELAVVVARQTAM